MTPQAQEVRRPADVLNRRSWDFLLGLWIFPALLLFWCAAATGDDNVIQARLRAIAQGVDSAIDGKRLSSSELLDGFYARSNYATVWVQSGKVTAHGRALVGVLGGAQDHGLDTRDYHLPTISARIAEGRIAEAKRSAELDLLLTDGALTYARHLTRGKVQPEQLYDSWKARPREQDVAAIVWRARSGDARALDPAYRLLAPRDPRYQQLKVLLRELGNSIGLPLPRLPSILLRLDDHSAEVSLLRKRLAAWRGDQPEVDPSQIFDIALEARVKQFQLRHGLEPDGVVGERTRRWLNKTYAERMRQVRVNLERWRWMPADLGSRRIEVNIAGFRVDVMEADRKVLSMRAIVGKPYHKTPVFSDRMAYLVLNPSWNVPWSIAVNEILPALQQDPSYLQEKNMRILSGWGHDAEIVDSRGIDWGTVTKKNFRYRFQQLPGDTNALGRVKFMFPNEFDVYLHDTPARSLFTSQSRGFSHGCVRLEKPMDLADYLLRGDERWTRERVREVLASGQETEAPVRDRLPVHIMYWTVWIDGAGLPHFRNDIYDRDEPLAMALIDD